LPKEDSPKGGIAHPLNEEDNFNLLFFSNKNYHYKYVDLVDFVSFRMSAYLLKAKLVKSLHYEQKNTIKQL